MRISTRSSIFGSWWTHLFDNQTGAGALIFVMGAALAMLVISASVGLLVRQDLRMNKAEAEARQVEALVTGAFRDAVDRAADPAWSTNPETICYNPSSYPVCMYTQARRAVATANGPYDEIPLRVEWTVSSSGQKQSFYGWVLIDAGGVSSAKYFHRWCTLSPDIFVYGPCKPGG